MRAEGKHQTAGRSDTRVLPSRLELCHRLNTHHQSVCICGSPASPVSARPVGLIFRSRIYSSVRQPVTSRSIGSNSYATGMWPCWETHLMTYWSAVSIVCSPEGSPLPCLTTYSRSCSDVALPPPVSVRGSNGISRHLDTRINSVRVHARTYAREHANTYTCAYTSVLAPTAEDWETYRPGEIV